MKRIQAEELIAKSVADAIATLAKIGWSYLVTSPDGQVFTNIERAKRASRKKLYNFAALGIEDQLLQSYPGEEVRVGPFEGIPLVNLQKAVSNYGVKVYGKNNFRTSVDKSTQQVVFHGGPRNSMSDLDAAIAAVAEANKKMPAQTHSATNKPQ